MCDSAFQPAGACRSRFPLGVCVPDFSISVDRISLSLYFFDEVKWGTPSHCLASCVSSGVRHLFSSRTPFLTSVSLSNGAPGIDYLVHLSFMRCILYENIFSGPWFVFSFSASALSLESLCLQCPQIVHVWQLAFCPSGGSCYSLNSLQSFLGQPSLLFSCVALSSCTDPLALHSQSLPSDWQECPVVKVRVLVLDVV